MPYSIDRRSEINQRALNKQHKDQAFGTIIGVISALKMGKVPVRIGESASNHVMENDAQYASQAHRTINPGGRRGLDEGIFQKVIVLPGGGITSFIEVKNE